MSKDFKPFEFCFVAEQLKQKNKDMRKANFYFTDAQGNTVPLMDAKVQSSYPELYFFFEGAKEIYYKYKGNSQMKRTLSLIQKRLLELEERLLKGDKTDYDKYTKQPTKDLSELSLKDVVGYWFYAGLDPSFYYRELNDKRFYDYIVERIEG